MPNYFRTIESTLKLVYEKLERVKYKIENSLGTSKHD